MGGGRGIRDQKKVRKKPQWPILQNVGVVH
jgi:hypothetical protein